MTLSNATTATQCSEILAYLETGKGITQKEAYRIIGTQRLSGRIWDLRQQGQQISTVRETVKNRHGRNTSITRYYLTQFLPQA